MWSYIFLTKKSDLYKVTGSYITFWSFGNCCLSMLASSWMTICGQPFWCAYSNMLICHKTGDLYEANFQFDICLLFCSPHGIFHLSDPSGVNVMRNCQQRGFHPHEEPEDGSPLYEHCSHVYINQNLSCDVVDLRWAFVTRQPL